MMKTGSALPMPKMNSARGIQAMPEMGRSSSIVGSITSSSVRYKPISRPSGTASTRASARLIEHAREADARVREQLEVARELDQRFEHRTWGGQQDGIRGPDRHQ